MSGYTTTEEIAANTRSNLMSGTASIEIPDTDEELPSDVAAARRQFLGDDRHTVATIARALNKKERTIHSWMAKGMPFIKFGATVYISVREAREWLIGQKDSTP